MGLQWDFIILDFITRCGFAFDSFVLPAFDSHSFAAKGLYSVFFPLLWLGGFPFPGPDL